MDRREGSPLSLTELLAYERHAERLREAERERLARFASQSGRSRPVGRSGAARLVWLRTSVTSALALIADRRTTGVDIELEP